MPILPDYQTKMSYQDKKAFFDQMLTIYGRKAVEEALLDPALPVYRLHLADSNKKAVILDRCIELAQKRGIEVLHHDRRRLSFISRNARQDQGIALDISLDNLQNLAALVPGECRNLLLLDNITNPQNVGMIIRSAAAGFIDGLVVPRKGCAELGPLVIKASAGALFKAPIYRCETSDDALQKLQGDYQLAALSLAARDDFFSYDFSRPTVFILGNESTGVSRHVTDQCHSLLKIPMNNGVESLNVAVTAALVAFHPALLPTQIESS